VTIMPPTRLKTFVHPAGVYRLEYPAQWETLQQDEARSCGFGPKERDDVGLWVSIMPVSVDTERLAEHLPELLTQSLAGGKAGEVCPDPSLQHYGLRADVHKEGQGGHYWIVAGGDVVLFASTQVPEAERGEWNPLFEAVMASLRITRENELLMRKAAIEVLEQLRALHPEEEFELDEKGIRGKGQVVYLSNLYREVRAAPHRREAIVKNFVEGLAQSADMPLGQEVWEEVCHQVLPLLKPKEYIQPDTPTRHLYTNEWLGEVVICYVIKDKQVYRFLTGWDLDRWGITGESLHQRAIDNLAALPWPSRLEGARQPDGGRLILVDTSDGLASSRLLHPELHRLFSGPLGSPFWAGVPDRETLVIFSDRRGLKKRLQRRLRQDHDGSAYPITPRPFLVTQDGIALGSDR
jgi:uncharacterized protein YtpQ (UPF0354 family)